MSLRPAKDYQNHRAGGFSPCWIDHRPCPLRLEPVTLCFAIEYRAGSLQAPDATPAFGLGVTQAYPSTGLALLSTYHLSPDETLAGPDALA